MLRPLGTAAPIINKSLLFDLLLGFVHLPEYTAAYCNQFIDPPSAQLAQSCMLPACAFRHGSCNNTLSLPFRSLISDTESLPNNPLANDLSSIAILFVRMSDGFLSPFRTLGINKISVVSCQPVCVAMKHTVRSRFVVCQYNCRSQFAAA